MLTHCRIVILREKNFIYNFWIGELTHPISPRSFQNIFKCDSSKQDTWNTIEVDAKTFLSPEKEKSVSFPFHNCNNFGFGWIWRILWLECCKRIVPMSRILNILQRTESFAMKIFKDATCVYSVLYLCAWCLVHLLKNGCPFDGTMTEVNDHSKLDKKKNYNNWTVSQLPEDIRRRQRRWCTLPSLFYCVFWECWEWPSLAPVWPDF